MIRVCIISQGLPERGGSEMRAYRHSKYLNSTGEASALLIAWNRNIQQKPSSNIPPTITPVTLKINRVNKGIGLWSMVIQTLHLCEIFLRLGWVLFSKRKQFEVIHTFGSGNLFNLSSIQIGKILNKPVITEMVGMGVDDPLSLNRRSKKPKEQIFPHEPIKYRLFRNADAFISKSCAISQSYKEAKLPEDKLYHIASGVDPNVFRPPRDGEEKKEVRDKLRLDQGKLYILFVGRIRKNKGLHLLLDALREINQSYPSVDLLVLGPPDQNQPDYFETQKKMLKEWGLSNKCSFLGRVPNVHEYMKAADIFALPTEREGFSGAILEAMCSGLPIVTSDIPEITDIQVKHGREGILVPLRDTVCLTNALKGLIENPALRKDLGQAAQERVLREFTFEVIGSKYLRLYREVLQQHGK